MICPECNNNFPEEILHPFFIRGEYSPKICGVCALRIINDVLALESSEFSDVLAEENRLLAIKHLERQKKMIKLKAKIINTNTIDGAEIIEVGTHKIQFGHGNGGDGYCYNHDSFDCICELTDEEIEAIEEAV